MSRKTDIQPQGARGGRRATRLLAGLAALGGLAVLAVGVAGAQTVDSLNSRIDSARGQADALGAEVQAKIDAAASARQEALAAAAREQQLSTVLARGQEREAALQARVEESQARLASARAHLRRALKALSDRLVAIYMDEAPDETTLLLNSQGFDDLTTRAELLGRIEASDEALAARVRTLKRQVAAVLARVSTAHAQAVAFDQRIATARDQISAVRANAEARAAALDAARQQQASALASLRSQVSGWEQQVQHLQAVSAAQAQQTVGNWFGDWAIPQAIVQCESGGNFGAVNPSSGAGGAYQILPSTWRLYGGQGAPQDASPEQQSEIAAQIWADSGPSAWVCAG
jgi:predicted  nucleic acid-binding Zn-ribbon protein